MNISNCWYDRACSSEDVYDRFICVYIAFNYLYAGTRQKNESERICATRYAEALCDKYDFDPFSCDVSEYVHTPVRDMLNQDVTYPVSNVRKGLFDAIYQVRCNLFHGNKCIGDPRDAKLVAQGSDVLIGLLSRILRRGEMVAGSRGPEINNSAPADAVTEERPALQNLKERVAKDGLKCGGSPSQTCERKRKGQ